ncbi:MAG: hypothetical protein J0G32_05225 [Alphaproteobacteria bacterium]|nr:hypothetical protein [Alphaproteobacteria bacterium]OJV13610.1 MAG: hypothetical protein BGO27_03235 [Alphaproteobacteria bacterium 33-17]
MTAKTHHTLLVNLGIITKPDYTKSFEGLTQFLKDSEAPEILYINMGSFKADLFNIIADFKLGKISEEKFDCKVLQLIEDNFAVNMTKEQFNNIWFSAYDTENFENLIKLSNINESEFLSVILYSGTNVKDLNFIAKALEAKGMNISYDFNEFNEKLPFEFGNCFLLSSCNEGSNGAELVKDAIELDVAMWEFAETLNKLVIAHGGESHDIPERHYNVFVAKSPMPLPSEDYNLFMNDLQTLKDQYVFEITELNSYDDIFEKINEIYPDYISI